VGQPFVGTQILPRASNHHRTEIYHTTGRAIVTGGHAPSKKLIIELDGSQHIDQEEYDKERTVFLQSAA